MTTNNNKLSASDLANRISACCSKGYITKYSEYIPSVTIHAYNRLIDEAGWFVGWENEESRIINSKLLIQHLETAMPLFERSRAQLIQNGLAEFTVNSFSPARIVEFGLSVHEADKELLLKLASCHLYCSIALLEMANFRETCGNLIDQYIDDISKEELSSLVLAQSRLVVAQESVNLAYKILYKAEDSTREKISTIDEVTLQLDIEKRKFGPTKGGKSSYWKKHQRVIEKHLELFQNRKYRKDAILDMLKEEIGDRPPVSTFDGWLRKYRDNQSIF